MITLIMKKTLITVLLLNSFLNLSAQQKKPEKMFLNADLITILTL